MASRRRQVRTSLLALLVSYLRGATVDTSAFGTYPKTQGDYSFAYGAGLYFVTVNEDAEPLLPIGVTIQFAGDTAETSRAMAQKWDVTVRVYVRTPRAWVGESDAYGIAEKIDQALYRSGGKIEIKDYDVTPPSASGTHLQWQLVPRGKWTFVAQPNAFDQLVLEFQATYGTPNL